MGVKRPPLICFSPQKRLGGRSYRPGEALKLVVQSPEHGGLFSAQGPENQLCNGLVMAVFWGCLGI